jgi:hypothetical protein
MDFKIVRVHEPQTSTFWAGILKVPLDFFHNHCGYSQNFSKTLQTKSQEVFLNRKETLKHDLFGRYYISLKYYYKFCRKS